MDDPNQYGGGCGVLIKMRFAARAVKLTTHVLRDLEPH